MAEQVGAGNGQRGPRLGSFKCWGHPDAPTEKRPAPEWRRA